MNVLSVVSYESALDHKMNLLGDMMDYHITLLISRTISITIENLVLFIWESLQIVCFSSVGILHVVYCSISPSICLY